MLTSYIRKIIGSSLLTAFTLTAQAEVTILSAVEKDTPIEGAKVIWQRIGESSQSSLSNNSGKASQPESVANNSNTTLIIEKEGYSTLVAKCPCDDFTYALSPVMANLDGLRVVLTWGEHPKDLDSHLLYLDQHVFFQNKVGNGSHLDVDDTTSYGPETITITEKLQGSRYVYVVHDYTNGIGGNKNYSTELSNSNVRVDVYVGETLIRRYTADANKVATGWIVFGIDENGAFQDFNKYEKGNRLAVIHEARKLLKEQAFTTTSTFTTSDITRAKKRNTEGEALYANKDLTGAMYAFQNAINLYPSYGQAYSNLGLTFQKLNRSAEGLWANRKAIELASGDSKNRVRASSYYNIARIYEAQGQWLPALDNYQAAKANRAHSAYDKGIARMKEKLGM